MPSQWTELANHYGGQYAIPPALILAIIDLESGGDPNDVNPRSNATGLMQITGVVVKDYNQRHKTSLTLEDAKDPETNVKMGSEVLKRITLAYEKFNGLRPAWNNANYIGLVVMGWNSGYSRKSGVSYILSRMAAAGIPKTQWDIKTVQQSAQKLSAASPWIKSRNLAWTYKVIETYFKILKKAKKRVAQGERNAERQAGGGGWSTGKKVLVYGGVAAGTVGLGYYIWNKSKERDAFPEYEEPAGLPGMPNIIVVK